MYNLYLVGTAGSGKSLLASVLARWYGEKGASVALVNLDPGALSLPYSPDIDIRNYIDLQQIMDSYQLGPNGALILACDLIATRLQELQRELDEINPEYAIIDTPGQIELFAFRSSGPFVVENLYCEGRVVLMLLDATLVSSPLNFIAIALLATSIQLRLSSPQIDVLSKRDLLGEDWRKIMRWSTDAAYLEERLKEESGGEDYLMAMGILRGLSRVKGGMELYPVSSVKHEGLVELSAAISRILKGGEEVED